MDTIKSFKGYGKVDPAEEQAFRRKTRKRLIILTVSVVLLLAVIIGAVAGTLIHNRKNNNNNSSSQGSNGSAQAMKAVCSQTLHQDSCYNSISELNKSNSTDPEELLKLSLQVVYNALSEVATLPNKLEKKTTNETVKKAINVCGTVLNDAVEYLQDCISETDVKSGEKLLTTPKIEDLKTWLSTVITNQETCLDALEEVDPTLLTETKLQMSNATEYASNSLAIVSKISGILGKLNLNMHRKLLAEPEPEPEREQEPGFPGWVSTGVRRLLQENIKPTPNVTVAADGSGDVKTIKEAMGMVKKKDKSVFVVYIKEGVYRENVVLDKSFWNVMIYGDGKDKSVVSGSLNFVDGTPTFSTATFDAFEYLKVNWLDPYREKFVAAWTDETLNFHQVTTNRVESMHALLKSDLPTHRTTLDKLVRFIGHMVDKQYTEIRRSFEESIRKVMNHHREEPMFAPLLRKVSKFALELLTFELRRMSEGLEIYGSTCNCSLYKSCGLPCACRLEAIKNKGQIVQLSSIDAHWKKLDFEPATKTVKDLDVDAEWEKIKQQFDFRPVQVKMSMFQKIKAIVTPSTNKKKPPVVKKNTRGRPTLKQQAERREEAERSSSYPATDQSDTPYGTSYGPSLDPPRHSSYVASTSSQKQSSGINPGLQRSKTTVRARTKTPEPPLSPHPDFPNMPPTRKARALIRNLGFLIPNEYRPYITKIKDVKPDGHCGFRATAVGIGQKQERHKFIRTKLLEQMRQNVCMWRPFFDRHVVGEYDKLYTRIDWQGRVSHATPKNYMELPNCGYLIAQEWGVIVHCIIGHTKLTIFPMDGGPEHAGFPHTVVPIQLVRGNHFIYLRFDGDYPMPPVAVEWMNFRRESAAGWYQLYEHRIVNEIPDLNQEPQDVG